MVQTRARHGPLNLGRQAEGVLGVELGQAATGVAEDLASAGAVRVEEAWWPELVNRFKKARHELIS